MPYTDPILWTLPLKDSWGLNTFTAAYQVPGVLSSPLGGDPPLRLPSLPLCPRGLPFPEPSAGSSQNFSPIAAPSGRNFLCFSLTQTTAPDPHYSPEAQHLPVPMERGRLARPELSQTCLG